MKFIFNVNTLHNVLNIMIAVLAALVGMDWSSIVSPDLALKIISCIAMAKVIISTLRDGITGLVKVQPPVKP